MARGRCRLLRLDFLNHNKPSCVLQQRAGVVDAACYDGDTLLRHTCETRDLLNAHASVTDARVVQRENILLRSVFGEPAPDVRDHTIVVSAPLVLWYYSTWPAAPASSPSHSRPTGAVSQNEPLICDLQATWRPTREVPEAADRDPDLNKLPLVRHVLSALQPSSPLTLPRHCRERSSRGPPAQPDLSGLAGEKEPPECPRML